MKKWKLGFIALSVSAAFSVQVAYAANSVSQQQVNDLFCNSNLPIPSNLSPASSPTSRNPPSQQYVCERYLAVKESGAPLKIGDIAGNGIVYYIDNVSRKGLIAAVSDASGGASWGPSLTTSATGVALFTGTSNTNILQQAGLANFPAAQAARTYPAPACPATITCDPSYSLPSVNELSLLFPFNNLANPGYTNIGLEGFSHVYYWSSTEFDANGAWVVNFYNGFVFSTAKFGTLRVRPVRAFSY